MNKKQIYLIGSLVFLAGICLSTDMFAETVTDFGAADIDTQASKIKNFLFGPPVKIACIFGGAWGLMQAIMTSTLRPLLLYGGIALGANIIPKFVDNIFVSGMLLP